jgi:hypothetical protein
VDTTKEQIGYAVILALVGLGVIVGTRIAACRLDDEQAVIDHTLYWATVGSPDEGRYLTAILNSDGLHTRVEPLMSEGLFGKRHVDKYLFAVQFPLFDPGLSTGTSASSQRQIAPSTSRQVLSCRTRAHSSGRAS